MKSELASDLKVWLGEEGASFFSQLKLEYDTVSPVLLTSDGVPHPVHFREGMQVRNWLRAQPSCKEWDDHKFDAIWTSLVEEALEL